MCLQVSVAGCFVFLFHPAKYVSLSMFLIAFSSHINLEQISLMSHTPEPEAFRFPRLFFSWFAVSIWKYQDLTSSLAGFQKSVEFPSPLMQTPCTSCRDSMGVRRKIFRRVRPENDVGSRVGLG